MSRPQKSGVDYFPLDVGFYSDVKIKGLKARFGADGIAIYIYILCEVYKDKGYYAVVDDDFLDAMSDDLKMNDKKIAQVIHFLLSRSLLDSTLFESDKVLTSPGIQRRFQLAVKVRAKKTPIEIEGKFWVLREDETEDFIKVALFSNCSENNPGFSENNPNSSTIYPQSKVKESKVKKSKGEGDSLSLTYRAALAPPTLDEVTAYCRERRSTVDPRRFMDFFTTSNWVDSKGNPVLDWRQKIMTWENFNPAKPPPDTGASFTLGEIEAVMERNTGPLPASPAGERGSA